MPWTPITYGKEAQTMTDDKKEKLNALSNKIKEHAAQTSGNDGTEGGKRGLFGFGNKPAAANNASNAVKPTATTAAAKQTAFTDVPASAYYAEAVAWAVQKGITSGTTPTTFAPSSPCHRGHVATFLWRSKGSPAPKTKNNPFKDVAADSPFYKAILWATENKIVDPKTANTYEPTTNCTRGEVLTALYRAEGKAGATESDALKWANTKKLLAGFVGGMSSPCTRADIVTFLYRVKK